MFCPSCGTSLADTCKFCTNCGFNVQGVLQKPAVQNNQVQKPAVQKKPVQKPAVKRTGPPVLMCPRCHGTNINVQFVEIGQLTKKKGNGLGGNVYNAARGVVAIGTLGISNIFIPKAHGKNKTQTVNAKMALCQNCGHSWEIKTP